MLKFLKDSRFLWRRREKFRYRIWRYHVRTKPIGHRLREKWYNLYIKARDNRKRRDKQIKRRRNKVTGVSSRGVNLIKEFEGLRLNAYRDPVGIPTIGYGHTKSVKMGQSITKNEAETLLRKDLDTKYFPYVKKLPTFKSLNQNQTDSLVSFVYNLGSGAIGSSTGIGKALRNKDWRKAADELLKWNRAGGKVLKGLVRRRKKERELFLKKN